MKQYIIGIGCRRNVLCSEIEKAIRSVLNTYQINKKSICGISSCDLKADEAGLLEFAERWKLPTHFFSKEELKSVSVPNPSLKVIEKIGIPSVSEAAAIIAGNGILVIEKQKFGNITIALAEHASLHYFGSV